MLVRAYAYVRALGGDGLTEVAEQAVLSANYLKERLKGAFDLPYDRICMHEFVLSGASQKREHGVRTLDMAKRLLDYGFHPPTIYFPLLVDEALMIEPTETEPLAALDAFAEAMLAIAEEVAADPDLVRGAPYTTPVRRLDEARAAREPVPALGAVGRMNAPRTLATRHRRTASGRARTWRGTAPSSSRSRAATRRRRCGSIGGRGRR